MWLRKYNHILCQAFLLAEFMGFWAVFMMLPVLWREINENH